MIFVGIMALCFVLWSEASYSESKELLEGRATLLRLTMLGEYGYNEMLTACAMARKIVAQADKITSLEHQLEQNNGILELCCLQDDTIQKQRQLIEQLTNENTKLKNDNALLGHSLCFAEKSLELLQKGIEEISE